MKIWFAALLSVVCITTMTTEPCFVVTDYMCFVPPLYGTKELQNYVANYLSLHKSHQPTQRIFIADLNGDNCPEYFVPNGCGATGNCDYLIFADHPARYIGVIEGKRIIFSPGQDWPQIRTLAVSGMSVAYITTYMFTNGVYQPVKEQPVVLENSIDLSGPRQIEDFYKRLGGFKCECPKDS